MTYLKEFRTQINERNLNKFLLLWEEYCASDHIDTEELSQIFQSLKGSEIAKHFGKMVETALPLLSKIDNKENAYNILRLLIDLQTSNSPTLAETAFQALKERYGTHPQFQDRIRIVGLRSRQNFQGAISNYELLHHMEKGNFVFHSGGWGTGEIVEVSPIRQQATVEFENVPGKKHFTFDHAFKSLVPLKNNHFLAQRFANPDDVEKQAREDSVAFLKKMLHDLGPLSAGDIKDLLVDIVIPEKDWSKWWQNARSRLKKDPLVECPEGLKEPFLLRSVELTQQDRLDAAIQHTSDVQDIIDSAYNFLRDMPDAKKNQEVRESVKQKLLSQLSSELPPEQELQLALCLELFFNHRISGKNAKELILKSSEIENLVQKVEIIALKKQILMIIRENRKDWADLFLNFMVSIKHAAIREYTLKELNQEKTKEKLNTFFKKLLQHPENHPEFFVWYFQKIASQDEDGQIPYSNKEGQCLFFDSFLILMNRIENKPEYKELTKKMYLALSAKRYEMVRNVMEGASLDAIRESLLLASKCHTLTDHDRQILRSLAAVVHPSLGKPEGREEKINQHTIWTTESGFLKLQEKIKHIGTVEVIENAREVEAARALGDLRENSEYKFAVERRARLQGQLKSLSDQLKRARILTKEDISTDEVTVGTIVDVVDGKGNRNTYIILGPFEADADKNILSFQSQLAQNMIGCKKGEKFTFRDEELKISNIKSYLEQ